MRDEPDALNAACLKVADAYANGRDYRRSAQSLARGLDSDALGFAAAWYLESFGLARVRETTKGKEQAAQRAHDEALKKSEWEAGKPARDAAARAYRAGLDAINDRHAARMAASLTSIMDDYASHLKAEWTADLLGAVFALGDGRVVTWGSATVHDHTARIEMLTRMATGTMETAALHRKAVDDLTSSGAGSLDALVVVGIERESA